MNQQQFDLIVKVIRNGAPALAEELVQAIVNLVAEHAEFKRIVERIENDKEG